MKFFLGLISFYTGEYILFLYSLTSSLNMEFHIIVRSSHDHFGISQPRYPDHEGRTVNVAYYRLFLQYNLRKKRPELLNNAIIFAPV